MWVDIQASVEIFTHFNFTDVLDLFISPKFLVCYGLKQWEFQNAIFAQSFTSFPSCFAKCKAPSERQVAFETFYYRRPWTMSNEGFLFIVRHPLCSESQEKGVCLFFLQGRIKCYCSEKPTNSLPLNLAILNRFETNYFHFYPLLVCLLKLRKFECSSNWFCWSII